MAVIVETAAVYTRFGMLDSGSNIQLAKYAFAVLSRLPIELESQGRCIGTADEDNSLPIHGWIDVGGFIGVMAVCKGASFTLLSVGICQSRGLGCDFPPSGASLDDLICRLYRVKDGVREEIHELQMDKRMELYYVDINSISDINSIHYVSQHGDYTGSDALRGGCLGVVCHYHSKAQFGEVCGVSCVGRQVQIDENAQHIPGTEAAVASESTRKRKPTFDMCRRVWTLHENLGHA